ncbi:reverse transcriptase [Tanacetum coccineum]
MKGRGLLASPLVHSSKFDLLGWSGITLLRIEYKRGNDIRLVGYSNHNVGIDDGHVFYLAIVVACQAIWLKEVLVKVMENEQPSNLIKPTPQSDTTMNISPNIEAGLANIQSSLDQMSENDSHKIILVSMLMFDKALNWHKQFVKRFRENVSWEEYEREIKMRFDLVFEDPMVDLKNLRQTTSVQVYQELFEALMNTIELTESYAISMFIGGLKVKIGMAVRMFKPTKLTDVYFFLAKMQHTIVVTKNRHATLLSTPKTSIVNANVNKSGNSWVKNTLPSQNTTTIPNRPFKRLTQQELEEKREKHLCFYCNQKYMLRYKCSGQVLSLEVVGIDMEEDGDLLLTKEGIVNTYQNFVDEPPLISLNALSGDNTYRTIRFRGCVGKNSLHVLVDSESTHNFLDLQTAKKLGYRLRKICPLDVYVANGNVMTNLNECKGFTWVFQGVTYTANVMILPLGGCDMVFGVQWLATMGSIQWNFKTLVMKFTYQNKKVILRGVIRNSQSPFSSPIVMVKGKDGSWRMCVDYKQLNKYTIKVKFTIPLIEELIDELNGAKAPVLAFLDFQKTFVVETDASRKGIGVLLQQEGHPIASLSKTLSPKHQALSTYEKEFLEVLMALDKWRNYFYKKGSENIVADALSRVSSVVKQLQNKSYVGDKYCLVDRVSRKIDKIVVGNVVQLRNNIIQHYHVDATGGHSDQENRGLNLRRRYKKSLIYNTSFLGEYECSSLALDRGRKKVEDEIGSLEIRLNYVSDQEI